MIVFKNYLKITKSYISIILIYTVIFISFAVVTSLSNHSDSTDYQKENMNIAFIDRDHSQFISEFKNYIQKNATIIDIDDNEEDLKDALFFRKVDFIMIIPDSFTEEFMKGQDVSIETMQVPDAYGAIYSKTLMNKYLNTARLYLKADIDGQTLSKKVKEDLSIETKVHMLNMVDHSDLDAVASFYNFSNYALLAIIIVIVSMIMVSFNETNIKKRNLVSCVNQQSFQFQLLLGNIVISLTIWAVYVIISFILYKEAMLSMNGLLYIINSLCLLIFILTFSFLVTKLTDNRELISGISNVVSLGCSFLGGAFVPQQYLGSFVLNIAHLTPSYWFIKNNNDIALLTQFDYHTLLPIIKNMGIILLFAICCYVIMLIINKLRLKVE